LNAELAKRAKKFSGISFFAGFAVFAFHVVGLANLRCPGAV
jgi:hypothetical protein